VKMRANVQELERAARLFADRLALSRGNACVMIAGKGWSSVNREGQAFYDPQADEAFVRALKEAAPDHVPVTVLDMHHNDAAFAKACADTLLMLMRRASVSSGI